MNEQLERDNVCVIPLTKGLFALVDRRNYGRLSRYSWHAHRIGCSWYAERRGGPEPGNTVFMQYEILPPKEGFILDHRNRFGLDNREINLRYCTHQENLMNRGVHNLNNRKSSKYKGVSFHKKTNKWQARIARDGKAIQLGYFESEIEAARAYDKAAIRLFGEFANINLDFPDAVATQVATAPSQGRPARGELKDVISTS